MNSKEKSLVYISLSELYSHPDNPRKDLGDLQELADSIKAKGVMQNLTVVPGHTLTHDEWSELSKQYNESPNEELRVLMNSRKSDKGYTVIIGHRRTEAARLAGLTELPCIITDLTPAEQIQTMLLENMQRSDLTVYEQAQGFQMMLDFGDTVESISEKTGFSATTVRRRLKMAELNQDTLKKVSSRQVSLFDFDKLAQIEDVEKRNEVLKEIGTANYERAIKNAIDAQTREKYECEWRTFLLGKGLAEIDYAETFGSKYHSCEKSYFMMGTSAANEYRLAGDEKYFSFNHKTVYFRRDNSKEDNQKAVEQERKNAIIRERKEKLYEATARAFSLRHDFVFGMSDAEAKKKLPSIIEYDIRRDWESSAQGGYYMRYIHENFTEYSLSTKDGYHAISEDVNNAIYRSFLRHVYVRWSDNNMLGYSDWSGKWNNNERLSLIYDFLIKLGYEISDEENALRDGTSELFVKSETEDENE